MDAEGYKKIIEELIKLIDAGVYVVDQDGIGMFYNGAMADMEQINIEDVVGKEFHKAFPGVKLAESTMYQALKKNVATKNKQQSYKNLYGKEITTINSTVPVVEGGRTIAAVEVAKDITNIRSMSDTILKLQEKKIELNEVFSFLHLRVQNCAFQNHLRENIMSSSKQRSRSERKGGFQL